MKFIETDLKGAFVIQFEPLKDERGFFSRSFCREEFERHGLNPHVAQCNTSWNRRRGTLRGFHYQKPPKAEAKLIRCIHGSLYDVIIDLRPASKTYHKWFSVELSRKNYQMLYVPEEFAQAIQTLEDDTEIFYQVSQSYAPDCERGIRWDDPFFKIPWALPPSVISERDKNLPDYTP